MSSTSPSERKTLILTGASRGIGHATVKRFASAGWRVITCSRHPFPENCPWEMGPEDHIQVDLSNAEDTERAVAEMRNRLADQRGHLNALVNNAGISPKGAEGERLGTLETPLDDWRRVFQVNFFAPVLLARGLLAELERAQGAVVNVTSIAGGRVHPFAGAAYATSKAALAGLTREMATSSDNRARAALAWLVTLTAFKVRPVADTPEVVTTRVWPLLAPTWKVKVLFS